MIKNLRSQQFFIFLITSGIAAFVNFFSRIIYNNWFSFSTSIVIAYMTGMITAYILARFFVFTQSQQSLRKSIIFFILVNMIAIIQTWLISIVFSCYLLPRLDIVMHTKEISHAIGIAIPVFTSYIGHKKWSFK
jgi:putative flippase GtrA